MNKTRIGTSGVKKYKSCFDSSGGITSPVVTSYGALAAKDLMTLHPYTVTQTDYHGTDYTANVYLTREQARDRIVDGRLLSPASGRALNYQRLWGSFKSMAWSEGGRTDTTAWVNRNVIKQQEDEYGK